MKIPRLFENQPFHLLDTIELEASTSHRLISVLRVKKEDPIVLLNGDGYEYQSVITHIKRHAVTVKILQKTAKDLESPLKIQLGQSISKGEKMDFVIQKTTELGVHAISPLLSERSVVQLKADRLDKKQEHWQKIAIQAVEQSGRCQIPLVETPISLEEWIKSRTEKTRLVLDPSADQTLTQTDILSPLALLIGPEGGLTEREIDHAKQYQFQAVKLGPRILRTETAALAIVAALQCREGDLR